uniref:Glutaredoxin domain-containing protein n=1 Tax=Panagrellus redivivus TaxID=6233 RepID=A0A7E4VP72_PANRE
MLPYFVAPAVLLIFEATIIACPMSCCQPPPIFLVRIARTVADSDNLSDSSADPFGSPEQYPNQYNGAPSQSYSNQGYGLPTQQTYGANNQYGNPNAYGNAEVVHQSSYGAANSGGYAPNGVYQPATQQQTTYYSTDTNQLGTQGAFGGFASAVQPEAPASNGYQSQQGAGGYAEQQQQSVAPVTYGGAPNTGLQTTDNSNLDNYAQYLEILQKQYGIKVPANAVSAPVPSNAPSAPASSNVYAAAVQQNAQNQQLQQQQVQQQQPHHQQQTLSSAVQGGTYTVPAGSPSPNVALPQGHHVGTSGFNPWQTGYMSNYNQQLLNAQQSQQTAQAPQPAPQTYETYQPRPQPQPAQPVAQPQPQQQIQSYETYAPQPQVQPQPLSQAPQAPPAHNSYETYQPQQPQQPQPSYQSSISTYGNDYSTESQAVAAPQPQPRAPPQVVPYQPQPLPPAPAPVQQPSYPIQQQQIPYQPPTQVQPAQPQPTYPNPQPLPQAPIQQPAPVARPAPQPLATAPPPVYTMPPQTEAPTTASPTTTSKPSAPLSSATSIQALTQQIRRLPAVLYVDSRNPESRRTENMLRETYGLPLVAFYVDKIDKPKTVERHLQQLTAHKGLPYLFICGTFIGSQQHIDNYHNNKQVPQLIEYVCGDEKKRKAKSAAVKS